MEIYHKKTNWRVKGTLSLVILTQPPLKPLSNTFQKVQLSSLFRGQANIKKNYGYWHFSVDLFLE